MDQLVFLPAGDRANIERMVQYMTRCPFSLSRLVTVTASGQVVYKARGMRQKRQKAQAEAAAAMPAALAESR